MNKEKIKKSVIRRLNAKLEILSTEEPLSEEWKKAEDVFVNILENYCVLNPYEKREFWDVYYSKVGVKV